MDGWGNELWCDVYVLESLICCIMNGVKYIVNRNDKIRKKCHTFVVSITK